MKKQLVTEKKVLLFIDTGDNCRCPMANGYLQKLLEQRGINWIEIKTAGVMTPTGLLPTPESVQLLKEEGINIERHRSRPLSPELIKRADLVLGMTPFHVQSAYRMAEEARGKTFLLKEYVGREGRNTQIADPMGGTLEIFKKCFNEIRASLQRLVEMDFAKVPPQPKERIVVDTTPVPKQEPGDKPESKKEHKPKPPVAPKLAEAKAKSPAKKEKPASEKNKPAKKAGAHAKAAAPKKSAPKKGAAAKAEKKTSAKKTAPPAKKGAAGAKVSTGASGKKAKAGKPAPTPAKKPKTR